MESFENKAAGAAEKQKNAFADALDPVYAELAQILSAVRQRAIDGLPVKTRMAFFETLADDAFLDMIRREGHVKALVIAEGLLEEKISKCACGKKADGKAR